MFSTDWTPPADQPRAVAQGDGLSPVGGGVIGHHQPGAREGVGQGIEGCADPLAQEAQLPEIEAHITGTVWKVEVEVGDTVEEGDTVVILESMKMEMPVEAEDPGVVREILCVEGQSVSEGDALVVLE